MEVQLHCILAVAVAALWGCSSAHTAGTEYSIFSVHQQTIWCHTKYHLYTITTIYEQMSVSTSIQQRLCLCQYTSDRNSRSENMCVADQCNTMIRIVLFQNLCNITSLQKTCMNIINYVMGGIVDQTHPFTTSKLNQLPNNPSEMIVQLYSAVRVCGLDKVVWFLQT